MSIRDFKYDFNSAKVDFTPILTEPNQKALPNSNPELPANFVIPEFSLYLFSSLFLILTLTVTIIRKKITGEKTVQ
jgi:hypothetical protein